ncbi:MAG: insulinase family protein [Bacteroidales bacterium]|nr:insulinase family protein [Bacteroidales bacterium]
MKRIILSLILPLVMLSAVFAGGYETKTAKDKNGYTYEYVTNDPVNARVYTLGNGLKVYMAVNTDEPRIQTYIAVRAGAKNDPRETTGLAHYFEHMMFKGTDEIATQDWEKESKLIAEISDLFELHAKETDKQKKLEIYHRIDSVSQLASQYAIANEYDKICTMMGATGTNAWTSYEETVYVNNIPTNEAERWVKMEAERFSDLVLRLFHTELETVFEEFNMTQDNDGRKSRAKLMGEMFKKHPYGVSVIGIGEHLKNPSMVNIMNFKANYYVPNNIAICLSGDFDPETMIKMIDTYWGKMKPNNNIPKFVSPVEDPITKPVEQSVYGPDAEYINIAYRTTGVHSDDDLMLTMIGRILSNGNAGLIDLNLVQQQKVLRASAGVSNMNDYGLFMLTASPRQGQTLEELKALLLGEIDKLKNGEFDEWLLEAIINQRKLSQIRSIENNSAGYEFVNQFITGRTRQQMLEYNDKLEKITKQMIVDFANKFFADNYVVVYKRNGANDNVYHVEKPPITPLTINRNAESKYVTALKNMKTAEIKPAFVDYKTALKTEKLGGVEFTHMKNETNEIFSLYYTLEMGRLQDNWLPVAISYLEFLGTSDKSAADLKKEWYRLGLSFGVSAGEDRVYVYLTGLDKNLEEGIALLEKVMADARVDEKAYKNYIDDIMKKRRDAKLNKNMILQSRMVNYSKYGKFNPATDILSESELRAKNPSELVNMLHGILQYKHSIFYYGPRDKEAVAGLIKKYHTTDAAFKEIPQPKTYQEKNYDKPKVYFVNYDMVQSLVMLVSKDVLFDAKDLPVITMFNEYYGGSMSSIVFQEIRESKGLAYSSSAGYRTSNETGKSNYVTGYLSTQPDKLAEALSALTGLLNELALSEPSFATSREAVIKQINSERIIKSDVYWSWQALKEMGIDYDYRKTVYEKVQNYSLADVKTFFDAHVKGKKFDILIVGPKDKIDFELLKQYGEIQELSLEEIFGY